MFVYLFVHFFVPPGGVLTVCGFYLCHQEDCSPCVVSVLCHQEVRCRILYVCATRRFADLMLYVCAIMRFADLMLMSVP